jgi:DNA-binding PadR family transcriptional regulator
MTFPYEKDLTTIETHVISITDIANNDTAKNDIMSISKENGMVEDPSELDRKIKKILPLTESTFYILISLVRPRHGYGIMQNVAGISADEVKLGPGTLYGALNTLLKQGLIERLGDLEGEEGGERRKIYGLTPLGRRAVEIECRRLETLAGHARAAMKEIGADSNEGEGR